MEASKRRANELRSPVSIAIVDPGGHLVLFERMMSPYGWATSNISIAKATTAVMFNQSTDSVAQWGSGIPGFASSMATMTQGKFIMAAGGWPIRMNGATIGGIGVSGGNAPGRDEEIARAGLAAVAGMAEAIAPAVPARPEQGAPQPQLRSSLLSMPSPSSTPLSSPQPPQPPQPQQAQDARELQGAPQAPLRAPTMSGRQNIATPYRTPEEDSLYNDEISSLDQSDENRGGQL
jgi:uncharacterized protein GlcG (DUF336 family)